MKIGDLICYNGAGQKRKTLGVIIDFAQCSRYLLQNNPCSVLVQWCVVGKTMPRKCYTFEKSHPGEPIVSNQIVWHPAGDGFEVVQ